MKPVIKWVGGKTQMLSQLRELITPELLEGHTYYEPFIGGGALAFDLEYKNTVIGDLNPELVNMYKMIKDRPEDLIELLKTYWARHCEEEYYKIRALDRDPKYTIEDYSGSYQFSAFGDAYQRFAALLKPNVYVYLTGVIQQRGAHMKWFKPKPVEEAEYEFALQQVQLIQDAQKDLRSITLQIPIENIQPDLIDELAEKNQQFAGETSLRLQIFDTIKQNVIMLNAAPIKLDKESYNWLKEKKQEEVLNYLIN